MSSAAEAIPPAEIVEDAPGTAEPAPISTPPGTVEDSRANAVEDSDETAAAGEAVSTSGRPPGSAVEDIPEVAPASAAAEKAPPALPLASTDQDIPPTRPSSSTAEASPPTLPHSTAEEIIAPGASRSASHARPLPAAETSDPYASPAQTAKPAPLEPAPLEPAPLEPAPLEPPPLEPPPLEPAPLVGLEPDRLESLPDSLLYGGAELVGDTNLELNPAPEAELAEVIGDDQTNLDLQPAPDDGSIEDALVAPPGDEPSLAETIDRQSELVEAGQKRATTEVELDESDIDFEPIGVTPLPELHSPALDGEVPRVIAETSAPVDDPQSLANAGPPLTTSAPEPAAGLEPEPRVAEPLSRLDSDSERPEPFSASSPLLSAIPRPAGGETDATVPMPSALRDQLAQQTAAKKPAEQKPPAEHSSVPEGPFFHSLDGSLLAEAGAESASSRSEVHEPDRPGLPPEFESAPRPFSDRADELAQAGVSVVIEPEVLVGALVEKPVTFHPAGQSEQGTPSGQPPPSIEAEARPPAWSPDSAREQVTSSPMPLQQTESWPVEPAPATHPAGPEPISPETPMSNAAGGPDAASVSHGGAAQTDPPTDAPSVFVEDGLDPSPEYIAAREAALEAVRAEKQGRTSSPHAIASPDRESADVYESGLYHQYDSAMTSRDASGTDLASASLPGGDLPTRPDSDSPGRSPSPPSPLQRSYTDALAALDTPAAPAVNRSPRSPDNRNLVDIYDDDEDRAVPRRPIASQADVFTAPVNSWPQTHTGKRPLTAAQAARRAKGPIPGRTFAKLPFERNGARMALGLVIGAVGLVVLLWYLPTRAPLSPEDRAAGTPSVGRLTPDLYLRGQAAAGGFIAVGFLFLLNGYFFKSRDEVVCKRCKRYVIAERDGVVLKCPRSSHTAALCYKTLILTLLLVLCVGAIALVVGLGSVVRAI
ncbi:MAG: hypothetical protein MJE77_46155 [Proteobacteria bacterium]|nr:hypothetical protein [Pseudomonadota bacterium]